MREMETGEQELELDQAALHSRDGLDLVTVGDDFTATKVPAVARLKRGCRPDAARAAKKPLSGVAVAAPASCRSSRACSASAGG